MLADVLPDILPRNVTGNPAATRTYNLTDDHTEHLPKVSRGNGGNRRPRADGVDSVWELGVIAGNCESRATEGEKARGRGRGGSGRGQLGVGKRQDGGVGSHTWCVGYMLGISEGTRGGC